MTRQNNNRGGQRGGNQMQQRQDQQDQMPAKTAAQVFGEIMAGVDGMSRQITASLHRYGTSYESFRATLMMAMRNKPDIMKCSATSIITGCMMAAIDGVELDGKEAALVPSNNKVVDFATGRESWRKDARYNIMVAGIRKQIIRGNLIRDVQTTVVYQNEKFEYERGLNPKLVHVPILDSEKRGPPVGAYSVAWFKDGGMPSFEVMNKNEIMAVKDMGQSGPVWKKPTEISTEMWRKTVLRRHRKALPGEETRVDMEAKAEFGFEAQLEVQGGNDGALPAARQSQDAPRREDFLQLDNRGADNGMPLDFGNDGMISAEDAEAIEREERGEQEQPRQQQRAAEPVPKQEPVEQKVAEKREPGPVPDGFETWEAWAADVGTKMKVATTLPRLDDVVAQAQAQFDEAPDAVRQQLGELYEEKANDHREALK